ncbi:MAG: Sarcosine oxidase [Chthonomonadaceae bacterium]|nr:Sarcosine oxidase [Chthonomonadaceae bacterium]
MRVVIVGVGGVGAMAAWRLAQDGHEVIALERFRIDHDLGSSYGDSRIVRRVYPDPLYTALMADSYALWSELDALRIAYGIETPLVNWCGGIFFGPQSDPQIAAAQSALDASQVPYQRLSAPDCAERFPAFRFDAEEVALFEPSMGFARASHCVRTAVEIARKLGAQIHEETVVAGIEAEGSGVVVTTESGEKFRADRLLIAAGAWTQPLLASLGVSLPLVVTRQVVVHLEPNRQPEDFAIGRLPVWIDAGANVYGFPHIVGGQPGVRVSQHDHGEATAPDRVDRSIAAADLDAVRRYAHRRFEGLSERVAYAKVCLYTNTPDSDFVIDTVPGLPVATFISACSGHGFKFTPLLGKIASALVTDQTPPYDLSRFRLDRFHAEQTACNA